MPLHFLLEQPTVAGAGDLVALTGAEGRHAVTVRRVRVGEHVTVGDGAGAWLDGVCETVGSAEVVVRIAQRRDIPPASPPLVLVQALAKGDRDELAVQAATELGVDEIVPWQAARSVSRWDSAKADKGRSRWTAIAREASKQALRAWLPAVTPVVRTLDLVQRAGETRMLVLEPSASVALAALPLDPADPRAIVLIVGPEGGVAPDELAALEQAGAAAVRLGTTVLRTSTAGPAAIVAASIALGRWGDPLDTLDP